jgi:MFS family permease
MGVFRLFERAGSIIGPLLAGVLIASFGFPQTFFGIGMITFVGTILFMLVFLFFDFLEARHGCKQE